MMILPLYRHKYIIFLYFKTRPHQQTLLRMAFYFATDYMRKRNYFMEGLSVSHPINPVPSHLKVALTLKEAAEYSNIGINKIDYMLRQPNCPFVLYVGTKKLVKRKEFEAFISKKLIL